ncbi:hypothetical protein Hypma_016395 [Hypsizygus marmoreus]|uniref:Uncharacterized protein n=1 Tax=Hypsizygus marmoreus TaxID=39966 RepID=A0A369J2Z2_HYPMA|nr:hypothetical protein Hypma_016395 [Hypsizygus marmoreus]
MFPIGKPAHSPIGKPARSPPFESTHAITTAVGDPQTETIPGHAVPLTTKSVREFLYKELSTERLSSVYRHLWMCGLRGNMHALHWQRMMSRTIVITENPALHLVWFQSTIYMKPIPRCLLDFSFWEQWICSSDGSPEGELLWKEANGFMMTYCHLIAHESDFRIALELGLLPPTTRWMQWCKLRMDLLASLSPPNSNDIVAPRYHFGELRLFRLNFVYRVFRFKPLGFHHQYRDYQTFFSRRFTWILALFVYASVILTAFQTVLATDTLPESVRRTAYWFAVLVLIAIAAGAAVQGTLFVLLVLFNLNWTLNRQ